MLSRKERIAALFMVDLAATWLATGSGMLDDAEEIAQWNQFTNAIGHRSVVVRQAAENPDGTIRTPVVYEHEIKQRMQCKSQSADVATIVYQCSLLHDHAGEHISFDHGEPHFWEG